MQVLMMASILRNPNKLILHAGYDSNETVVVHELIACLGALQRRTQLQNHLCKESQCRIALATMYLSSRCTYMVDLS